MKYFIEDPNDFKNTIEIPKIIQKNIILNYFKSTYYWTVGILCLIIGFLVGTSI